MASEDPTCSIEQQIYDMKKFEQKKRAKEAEAAKKALLEEQAEKAQKAKREFNERCEHLRNFFSVDNPLFAKVSCLLKQNLDPSCAELFNQVQDAFLKQKQLQNSAQV